jgi:hypothetical protein
MRINKFNLATFVIILFFTSKVSSQNATIYQITPEISKKIISKDKMPIADIYHITNQKIKYNEYEMGEIVSEKYKKQLLYIENNKKQYDISINDSIQHELKKSDWRFSIELIDEYLKSNLKNELKNEYIIQSIELLKKSPLKVDYVKQPYDEYLNDYLNGKDPERKNNIFWLKACKKAMSDIINRCDPFVKSEGYLNYKKSLKYLEQIKKMVPGMVKSKTESEREVKLVDINKVDINTFNCTFNRKLPPEVWISEKNSEAPEINKSIVENEIVETTTIKQYKLDYDSRFKFSNGYIIEDINTKEQYLIPSRKEGYLTHVRECMEEIELLEIIHDLGYKDYEKEFYDQLKGKYNKLFIKTKTAEIELTLPLYDRLRENKSFLTDFDNDHNKFKSLIKQCITYTELLSNYINIYNVKRTNTPLSIVNEWKTKQINSNKLVSQLAEIRAKYAFIYEFLESGDSLFQNFLDVSITSGNILGIRN